MLHWISIMGIDGSNTLQIRGPPADLDMIEETMCFIDDCGSNAEFMMLHQEYFMVAKYERAAKNYLLVFYEFRNEPPHEYLEELLEKYPRCWMKNSFRTEDGNCGYWIAQYNEGVLAKQEHEWFEMGDEEATHFGLIPHKRCE